MHGGRFALALRNGAAAMRHGSRGMHRSASSVASAADTSAKSTTGATTMAMPPIKEEIPGLPTLKPAHDLAKPKTQISTLSNGLRVASEETYGQVSSVALFVDAGSRYETAEESGVCHFLETVAFKRTASRTVDRIRSETEGHQVFAAAARDSMMYKIDALRDELDMAVDFLSDAVMNPLLSDEEMEEARNVVAFQLEDVAHSPESRMQENLVQNGFGPASPLGRPLVCPSSQIDRITPELMRGFMAKTYTPSRMVLAASGVDHDSFVALAQRAFGHVPASNGVAPPPNEPDVYVGGATTTAMELPPGMGSEYVHAAVCFPSGGWDDEDIVPMCVLDTLLGGGSSFSAGGPGKGMYSRLYLEVLNRFAWVEMASAFSLQFNSAGLQGIYGQALPANLNPLIGVIAAHLRLAAERRVTEAELSRARNQLRGGVMLNLERRGVLCEDIGRQVLTMGKREDPAELCAKIEAVTADDLTRISQRVFEHPPTVSIVGPDVSGAPSYEEICNAFSRNA